MHDLEIIVGTRPNFVKAAPLIHELRRLKIKFKLVHSGQHYDSSLYSKMFEGLQLQAPDVVFKAKQNLSTLTSSYDEFLKYFELSSARTVIVFGDVDTTLSAAIAAKRSNKTLVHIEAGLRSFDRSMPEEINRIMVDRISDLFICTEDSARSNLINEGLSSDQISLVGNLMIDNLKNNLKSVEANDEIFDNLNISKKDDYAVVTLHRQGLCENETQLMSVMDAINEISKHYRVILVCHPRLEKSFNKYSIFVEPTITTISSLSYLKFLNLWVHSNIVLTDSGGLQEETTAISIDCLTIRKNTERPITIELGTNCLVGYDKKDIVLQFEKKTKVKTSCLKLNNKVPHWDGYAANRIVNFLDKKNIFT